MRTRNNKTHKKTHKKKTLNKRKPKNTTVKKIKKRKIVKGGEEPNESEDNCAICLETLNNPDNQDITLSCQHKFHRNCMIDTCRNMRGACSCPLCRRVLPFDNLNALGISPVLPLTAEQPLLERDMERVREYERRQQELDLDLARMREWEQQEILDRQLRVQRERREQERPLRRRPPMEEARIRQRRRDGF
jgi:hypothetical protein